MAGVFRTLILCFFVLVVALAVNAKASSNEHGDNSASMESNSSSDEHSDEDTTYEETTRTQPPPEPLTSSSTATPSISPSEFCRSNTSGNYINPNDCKTYIACSNGYAYVMPCPANLVYNEGGWCDYIQNVPRCM